MIETILDTDIGSDVDDALALGYALMSPEIVLHGITTVYGDTILRARIAKTLSRLAGKPDIPVYAGLELPLFRERPVHWMGHEGRGMDLDAADTAARKGDAVGFIVDSVRSSPGRFTIIAIGPLTNIAAALVVAPDIVQGIREIIFIGGVARLGDNALEVPALEWNVRCDPEAARVVFRSGIQITMLGMDVTRRRETRMDDSHLKALIDAPRDLARQLGALVEVYWEHAEPQLRCMHDVVAVAFAADRTIVETERLAVAVETRGIETEGFTIVSAARSETKTYVGRHLLGRSICERFVERVCAPNL